MSRRYVKAQRSKARRHKNNDSNKSQAAKLAKRQFEIEAERAIQESFQQARNVQDSEPK